MPTVKDFVSKIFSQWEQGDSAPFFNALAADVVWTTIGTTQISGTFYGKDSYLDKVYKPLLAVFAGPTRCRVKRILADGDTVIVEWHGETPTTAGPIYSQQYCWLLRVTPDRQAIQEVTGYYDTSLVNELLSEMKTI